MNEQIEKGILEGRVILFLGAGASLQSKNQSNNNPPLGKDLAKILAEKAGWQYAGEPLSTVYSAAKKAIGIEVDNLLEEQYKYCAPSPEYETISTIPWSRIYTTNIDDALEKALGNISKQKVNIKQRSDRIEDKDQLLSRLEYVYLNGSVKAPDCGYVFSAEEYGKANANTPRWYEELAADFFQCTFIFIGTALDEPIFYHQIERYKERSGIGAPLSYVLTPSATPIQVSSFDSYGLVHIAGTLSDFCSWIKEKFEVAPEPLDIAKNKFPELKRVISQNDGLMAELLKDVVIVSRQSLSSSQNEIDAGTIRQFYRGFKPTWQDVLDAVPAELAQFYKIIANINDSKFKDVKLFALIGPAGSGKSTMLKMVGLSLSDKGEKVYYLPGNTSKIIDVLEELEKSNDKKFFVLIERIDPFKDLLSEFLGKATKVTIISLDGQNVWYNRLESKFKNINSYVHFIDEIDEGDVIPILNKLRKFGPWTRLSGLTESKRKKELYERSKRQLLIGLMETTTGIGFEQIIQREYESIVSEGDKFFFVLCCLATMHRCVLTESIASRALSDNGLVKSPQAIAQNMKGIIVYKDSQFSIRHPVYARKIIESVIDTALIARAVSSILSAYRVYSHPVVKDLGKNEADLFKAIINHRFLVNVLRSDENEVSNVYRTQEKYFEKDGLFWLQYGLFKRDFHKNIEAFEILQTAYNAYPHDHTVHALAQQKLILSSSDLVTDEQARNHLSEALDLLENLDRTLESDDTYPIVSMAEGHVSSMIKLDGIAMARIKAREYVDRIDQRLRRNEDQRLKNSKAKLMKLATTGVWGETA